MAGTIYFSAQDTPGSTWITLPVSRELWRSDGTAAGTVFVKDLRPGVASADPTGLTVVGNVLYFTALDQSDVRRAWKTDGTDTGTTVLGTDVTLPLELAPGTATPFIAAGDHVYFRGSDASRGSELWKSSLTNGGSACVKDVQPGTGSSNATPLWAVGGYLYFSANDGVHGSELWRTDGTEAGTVRQTAMPSGTPPVLTASAEPVTLTAAPASGLFQASVTVTVNPSGTATAVLLEYGLTASYGNNSTTILTDAASTADQSATAQISSLTSGATYQYRFTASNASGNVVLTGSFSVPTQQQHWRQTHFGTSAATGTYADDADHDHDGLSNLIEFAFALDPTRATSAAAQLPQPQRNGNDYEVIFTRPAHTNDAGLIYIAQWSESLLPNSWQFMPNIGTGANYRFTLSTASRPRVFVRLKVTAP